MEGDYTGKYGGGSIYGKIEYVVLVSLELEKHIHSYISSEIQKLHGAVEI